MHFYTKTWFILILVIITTGLVGIVLFLQDLAEDVLVRGSGNARANNEISDGANIFSSLGPTRGVKSARLYVVEFSDFQCPFCKEAHGILKQVFEKYGDAIYFQYRHFPIENIHPLARLAGEASMCANAQGKFWEYHDLIFENQDKLNKESFDSFADALSLDKDAFSLCLKEGAYTKLVEDDFNAGRDAGVNATPTFFINGRKIQGVLPFEIWEELVKEAK